MQATAQPPGANGGEEAAPAAWRERLANAPLLLQLPADLPPPDAPSGRTAGVTLTLPGPEAAAARALAEGEGASLLDTLLAGWQALLRRYARVEAAVTGVSLSNTEAERLDGAAAQLVPILTDLTGALARAHACGLPSTLPEPGRAAMCMRACPAATCMGTEHRGCCLLLGRTQASCGACMQPHE